MDPIEARLSIDMRPGESCFPLERRLLEPGASVELGVPEPCVLEEDGLAEEGVAVEHRMSPRHITVELGAVEVDPSKPRTTGAWFGESAGHRVQESPRENHVRCIEVVTWTEPSKVGCAVSLPEMPEAPRIPGGGFSPADCDAAVCVRTRNRHQPVLADTEVRCHAN